jgi:hypothetical protein
MSMRCVSNASIIATETSRPAPFPGTRPPLADTLEAIELEGFASKNLHETRTSCYIPSTREGGVRIGNGEQQPVFEDVLDRTKSQSASGGQNGNAPCSVGAISMPTAR